MKHGTLLVVVNGHRNTLIYGCNARPFYFIFYCKESCCSRHAIDNAGDYAAKRIA